MDPPAAVCRFAPKQKVRLWPNWCRPVSYAPHKWACAWVARKRCPRNGRRRRPRRAQYAAGACTDTRVAQCRECKCARAVGASDGEHVYNNAAAEKGSRNNFINLTFSPTLQKWEQWCYWYIRDRSSFERVLLCCVEKVQSRGLQHIFFNVTGLETLKKTDLY